MCNKAKFMSLEFSRAEQCCAAHTGYSKLSITLNNIVKAKWHC